MIYTSNTPQHIHLGLNKSSPLFSIPTTTTSTHPNNTPSPSTAVQLEIHNTEKTTNQKISFTCLTFSKYLNQIATIDQRGNLFLIDLTANSYSLIAKVGVSGTCITFGAYKKHEIYVGLSNSHIQCFNSHQTLAKLSGHRGRRILHVSAHPARPLLLSCSDLDVVLWDTEQWVKKRLLSGAREYGVHQACFSPLGDMMMAMFRNATMVLWNSDTFAPVWKINLANNEPVNGFIDVPTPFSISYDQVHLAVASTISGSSVFVWNVATKSLLHEILIPNLEESRGIFSLQFVGKTNVVGVLSLEGLLVFIDAVEGKLITKLAAQNMVLDFDVSLDGVHMVSIMKPASTIKLWDFQAVLNPELLEKEQSYSKAADVPVKETIDAPQGIIHEESPHTTYLETTKVPKRVAFNASKKEMEQIIKLSPNNSLNMKKLKQYIEHFGEFPSDYRLLIWRFLLQIPENRDSYEALVRKKTHPSLRLFRERFPLKSERLGREMNTIMSALIHWSPVFENLDYLPTAVFPFVKVFKSDTFACFESLLTIFTNWCAAWWEFYPNPPIQVLDQVEDLLQYHDKRLYTHFKNFNVSSQMYAWPLLSSMMSDVLCKKDWLIVWDNILFNDCDFIYYVVVAFLKTFRVTLFQINRIADFKYFLSKNSTLKIGNMIKLAYDLKAMTPNGLAPTAIKFQPLTKGHYPIFNKYPEHIVNYQKKLRERIRLEEEEYLRKKYIVSSEIANNRKISAEITKYAEELKKENKAWKNIELQKSSMLEKWWDNILDEEEKHLDSKMAQEAYEDEQRVIALQEADKAQRDLDMLKKENDETRKYVLGRAMKKSMRHKEKEAKIDSMQKGTHILEETWTKKKNQYNMAKHGEDVKEKAQFESNLKM